MCLCGNKIRDQGAIALAELAKSSTITSLTLYLRDNKIREEGAIALAELAKSPCLLALTLHLCDNKISEKGKRVLERIRYSSNVKNKYTIIT